MTVDDFRAIVEWDCAHGTIEGPLDLDSRGRFDVIGSFVEEQGGPVRPDAQPNSVQARYSGTVAGREMQLTVTLTAASQVLGTYQLSTDRQARLIKCL